MTQEPIVAVKQILEGQEDLHKTKKSGVASAPSILHENRMMEGWLAFAGSS